MRRPRRDHSGKFKSKVSLAALKGNLTVIEPAQSFDVHANQISQLKKQLLEGGDYRLGEPNDPQLATIQYLYSGLLCRGSGGNPQPLWDAGILQHR